MTYTLTTAVAAVLDRVLLMERAAVSDSVNAVGDWIHWEQQVPYWVNRIAGLSEVEPNSGYYDLRITMRLIICHISQVNTPDGSSNTPQVNAFTYVPETIAYFETYRQLNMPGQGEVQYLDPFGVTISSDTGSDLVSLPGQQNVSLRADFELSVPLRIMSMHGG